MGRWALRGRIHTSCRVVWSEGSVANLCALYECAVSFVGDGAVFLPLTRVPHRLRQIAS